MYCLICENLSWHHICKECQKNLLTPSLYKRVLPNGIVVYSFYRYDEIKPLLFTKHTELGKPIFTILANNSFKPFAHHFHSKQRYGCIALDDRVKKDGYSHTAILAHALKSYNLVPLYKKLQARNDITYSGKSKSFRQTHKRDFRYKKFSYKEVIVIDDIITTGATLLEATQLLTKQGKEVAFCLTLCDASLK